MQLYFGKSLASYRGMIPRGLVSLTVIFVDTHDCFAVVREVLTNFLVVSRTSVRGHPRHLTIVLVPNFCY
jgi:hypothetical protein